MTIAALSLHVSVKHEEKKLQHSILELEDDSELVKSAVKEVKTSYSNFKLILSERLHYCMKNREYYPMLELFSRAQRFNSWLSSVCILPVAFFTVTFLWFFKRALFSLGWISSKRTPEAILIELKPKARLWQPKYVTVWGYYTSNKSKLQHPPQAFELLRFASFKPPYPPSSRAKIAYKCPNQYWKTLCVINKYCWR